MGVFITHTILTCPRHKSLQIHIGNFNISGTNLNQIGFCLQGKSVVHIAGKSSFKHNSTYRLKLLGLSTTCVYFLLATQASYGKFALSRVQVKINTPSTPFWNLFIFNLYKVNKFHVFHNSDSGAYDTSVLLPVFSTYPPSSLFIFAP